MNEKVDILSVLTALRLQLIETGGERLLVNTAIEMARRIIERDDRCTAVLKQCDKTIQSWRESGFAPYRALIDSQDAIRGLLKSDRSDV